MGKQAEARERWRERVLAQEASGLSVRAYCEEHGVGEYSLYAWRRRLRAESEPVSFALVQAKTETLGGSAQVAELILTSGERLRIPCEEAVLGVVLRTLRSLG